MNVLDELDELAKAKHTASSSLVAKAVRRMKRDRLTMRKMEARLRWYDLECRRLKELNDLPTIRRELAVSGECGVNVRC